MSEIENKFDEMIEQEEALLKEIYNDKLKHLDNELKIRLCLGDKGFKVVEPKFEYENTPEYIQHQKNSLELAVKEEKMRILSSLNTIERKRLEREDIKKLRAERLQKNE